MKTALLLAAILLSGCKVEYATDSQKTGDARIEIFKQCMNLAAKMPRQADDDVADVVKQCSQQSYAMTRYIK